MGRFTPLGSPLRLPQRFGILLLLVAAIPACKSKLAEESPILARADLKVDRLAVVGLVSDVPAIRDTLPAREYWADLAANQLGRDRFGNLPVVSFREVRSALGADTYDALLEGYKADGRCDSTTLGELANVLQGQARFLVFGRIQADNIGHLSGEDKEKHLLTYSTHRKTQVRIQIYDVAGQVLAWDHIAYGEGHASQEYDNSELFKHSPGEGVLGGLAKSLLNSMDDPEREYPDPPSLEGCLGNALDEVGAYLKPGKR